MPHCNYVSPWSLRMRNFEFLSKFVGRFSYYLKQLDNSEIFDIVFVHLIEMVIFISGKKPVNGIQNMFQTKRIPKTLSHTLEFFLTPQHLPLGDTEIPAPPNRHVFRAMLQGSRSILLFRTVPDTFPANT